MNTKEMILDAALALFSKRGVASSSVRDIAALIRIKDSSLYFHYKSKQAILDALMEKFINTSKEMMMLLDGAVETITEINDEQFHLITQRYIEGYFMDTFIRRFIMVMNHERTHNEQLREHYICWCIEKPIEFQMSVIKKLQDIGYLQKLDVRYMTLEYYAPIFLFFNQYMDYDDNEQNKSKFKEAVMNATTNFVAVYKRR